MLEPIQSMCVDLRPSLLENKGKKFTLFALFTQYTETGPSSFESLSVELLYELLEYFNLEEIVHSFINAFSQLDWIIVNDSRFHFRGVQLSSKSPHLHPGIDETRIVSLALRHTAVCLSSFVNLRSLSLRTRCSCPDRLQQMSQELSVLTRLISFKLDITGYYWDGNEDSEDPEDESYGLIPAAFGHPTLQRFIFKAPFVSFPQYNNGLSSILPISTSLKYVEIPTSFTSFYFIDPLNLLPVVRHIHFGLQVPHRLIHPHTYLRSLILELYYWPLIAFHSFLVQLIALQKLTVHGFADREENKLFDYTCLLPILLTLRQVDINISICVQPVDETVEQFKQELEQEHVRNGWQELHITPIIRSCTTLKGLFKKK